MDLRACTGDIIDAGMKVHTFLGPGLVESAYQACLAYELRERGHEVLEKHPIPILYGKVKLDTGYLADMLVDAFVIVELKAVERLHPIHEAQLLSYLKLSGKTVGLLLNFHELHLKDGIRRLVNNY
jgi:GxxExxY protein